MGDYSNVNSELKIGWRLTVHRTGRKLKLTKGKIKYLYKYVSVNMYLYSG